VALPAGVGRRGARTEARPASPRPPSREIPLEDLDSSSPTTGAVAVAGTGLGNRRRSVIGFGLSRVLSLGRYAVWVAVDGKDQWINCAACFQLASAQPTYGRRHTADSDTDA
jgi:hypothetical protein